MFIFSRNILPPRDNYLVEGSMRMDVQTLDMGLSEASAELDPDGEAALWALLTDGEGGLCEPTGDGIGDSGGPTNLPRNAEMWSLRGSPNYSVNFVVN